MRIIVFILIKKEPIMTANRIGQKELISRGSQMSDEPQCEKIGKMEKGYKIKQVSPSFGTCCKVVVNTALFILAASAFASFKFRS